MTISPTVARHSFIVPALTRIGLYSVDAERLLMGTAAVESNFHNFVQFGGGPARGMFQMELATFDDIVNRVLSTKPHQKLRSNIFSTALKSPPSFLELTHNHLFAAALARAKYFSIHAPIPESLEHQAHYWWTFYNGKSPHGLKPKDYIASWHRYCAPLYTGAVHHDPLPTTMPV